MGFMQKYALKTRDDQRTRAAELTLRQSLYPLALVTTLFFLWVCSAVLSINTRANTDIPSKGFSYGLLDTLNKHFQNTLHITKARSSGLQAAYFGSYPLVRYFGYSLE
jgi:FHS family L-fucose permease-like MFS transporter